MTATATARDMAARDMAAETQRQLGRLCGWAVAAMGEPLPGPVRRRASLVLADDIAAMTVASREDQVRSGQTIVLRDGAGAVATVFAEGAPRGTRTAAAAANGLAITWAELDEGFRPVPCHAGAYILPALLAEAEAEGAPVGRVLSALAVAYEITGRVALAFPFPGLTIHPHGAFNAIGAATGLSLLRGHDAATLEATVTAAATLVAAGPFNHAIDGALVRNVWTCLGATAGFRAADFAPLGIAGLGTALTDVFVGGFGCRTEPERLDPDLQPNGWAIESGYHKLFACCQYIHSAVEAGLELAGRADRRPVAIEVETHDKALALTGVEPGTVLAAKFSVAHAMAATAIRRSGSADSFEAATLQDPDIAALRRNVSMTRHPAIQDWPLDRPARVHWLFEDGSRVSASCENARGGADQPFGEAELLAKFADLTVPTFPNAADVLAGLLDGSEERDQTGWADIVRDITRLP